MNNFMYTVVNADIPVIYIGVSIHIHVKCPIGHSVNRYIAVSALVIVMCVIRHSVTRAI
jgi:hypothetical protein